MLLASGVACAWLGVRYGFIRRTMRTTSGVLTGGKAVTAGALYVATGVAGIWGAVQFLLRAR